ncbi:MAG: GNAT family N-acetyltransferase [Candidatus Hodarchaeales archaeon]
MKNIVVRTANPSDINSISKIEDKCFPDKQKFGKSIIFALLYMSPRYMSFTALIGKEIVGYIIGEVDENETSLAKIVTIAVKSEYRRMGVGKNLLKTLEKQFKDECQIKRVQLQVYVKNRSAIDFYKNNNYKILKEIRNYYARNENAFLMSKELD